MTSLDQCVQSPSSLLLGSEITSLSPSNWKKRKTHRHFKESPAASQWTSAYQKGHMLIKELDVLQRFEFMATNVVPQLVETTADSLDATRHLLLFYYLKPGSVNLDLWTSFSCLCGFVRGAQGSPALRRCIVAALRQQLLDDTLQRKWLLSTAGNEKSLSATMSKPPVKWYADTHVAKAKAKENVWSSYALYFWSLFVVVLRCFVLGCHDIKLACSL